MTTITADEIRKELPNFARVVCEYGNNNKVTAQLIEWTDFPLPEITLWFSDGIIFLPSEY